MSEEIQDTTEESRGGTPKLKAQYVLGAFAVVVLAAWLLSGIYQVKADQVAIVERLGAYLKNADGTANRVEQGLHYHLPWPIDTVHVISIQQTKSLKVTMFNTPPTEYEDFKRALLLRGERPDVLSALFDPYLITGDKNVVHMEISVVYRINDPEAWLNTVSHDSTFSNEADEDKRNSLFQQVAQRAMVQQIGRLPLRRVLFSGRGELPAEMLTVMQDAVQLPAPSDPSGKRRVSMGIQVLKVEVTSVGPPDAVKSSFDQVQQQKSARDAEITKAGTDAESKKTEAKAQMTTLVLQAEQYRATVTQAAMGEAARFAEIYTQYQNAPDLTRWNVFADAVRTVSHAAKRMIFAQPGQKSIITVDPPEFDVGQVTTKPAGG